MLRLLSVLLLISCFSAEATPPAPLPEPVATEYVLLYQQANLATETAIVGFAALSIYKPASDCANLCQSTQANAYARNWNQLVADGQEQCADITLCTFVEKPLDEERWHTSLQENDSCLCARQYEISCPVDELIEQQNACVLARAHTQK